MSSMTFLELVKATFREYGLSGAGPVSVANQIGRNADVVSWVQQAHERIQMLRDDWSFDWAQGTFDLAAGKDTYDPVTDFGITGIRDFKRDPMASYVYPASQGVNARLFLQYQEWEDFRGLTIPPAQGSQPVTFTRRPDGKLVYYPVPSQANKVVHEYTLPYQTLTANTDVPRMPDWSHMAIAWRAVMIGCGKTGNFSRFDTAEEEFESIKARLFERCTPAVRGGEGPLA